MKNMRCFGDNIAFLLRGKDEVDFASTLGFTARDVAFMKEGRLILSLEDIGDIAEYFHVPRESLFERHPGRSQVHVLGKCDDATMDKVLDLFDVYCDLAEASFPSFVEAF